MEHNKSVQAGSKQISLHSCVDEGQDYDTHTLVGTDHDRPVWEYPVGRQPGEPVITIQMQSSQNLLDKHSLLFAATIESRIDSGAMVPQSAFVARLNIDAWTLDSTFHVLKEIEDGSYIGVDVDPTGRYAVVGIVYASCDGASLLLYDSQDNTFKEIDTLALMGSPFDHVRWGTVASELLFWNYYDNCMEKVGLDIKALKVSEPSTTS